MCVAKLVPYCSYILTRYACHRHCMVVVETEVADEVEYNTDN